jgi:hypothetical protein
VARAAAGTLLDQIYAPQIAPVSIVICEGETEDDCLLLHHFNRDEPLDSFT